MGASPAVLLKQGIILQHDEQDRVNILRDTDLLIENGLIARIGKSLQPGLSHTKVIDCRDKIVSPGFVDTHHHLWQTPLKGCHSDDTLLDYYPKGNAQQYNFTTKDAFWGELGGMLEALDGGTTCIVDHAHTTHCVDQAYAGIAASAVSGIRSIFCYTMVPRLQKWNSSEFELEKPHSSEEFLASLSRVSEILPTQEGRVTLGMGFDNFAVPEQEMVNVFEGARNIGVKLISSHWHRTNIQGAHYSAPKLLHKLGLLRSDVLIAHANGTTDEEFALLKDAGVYVCSTPGTETQMGHGEPMAFRSDVLGALGADCSSNNPGTMMDAMRLGLAVARCSRNETIKARGKFPRSIEPTTLQAFNMATIGGARAVGLERQIGSLGEGKLADIVVFNTSSPAMICAADENPLAAVVRHANPQDIEMTIVAGQIRKENGSLRDSSLKDIPETLLRVWPAGTEVGSGFQNGRLDWREVAKQLRRTRVEVLHRSAECSMEAAREKVVHMWTGGKDEDILA